MASSELAVQSISEIAEPLMYVEKSGGGYGGWRVELLSARVLSKSEEKLILCVSCGGLLREASLWERGEKQELICSVCLPKGIYMLNVRAAEMIREAINERQVNCPLKKCKWESSMDKLRHHLEEKCPFLLIPFHCLPPVAEGKCSANGVERGLMDIHKKEVCPIRLIRCVFCDKKVENCQIIAHQEECPFVPIPCPLKCLRPVTEREWSVNRVERRLMDIHTREVCPRRLIRCEFCDKEIESCQMIAHLEECEDYLIPCPNACLEKNGKRLVKRRDLLRHVTEECPLQIVNCKECGAEIERFVLEKHEIVLCPMRVKSGHTRWKIVDVKKSIRRGDVRTSFDASGYKFQTKIWFNYRNSGYVGCYVRILRGHWDSFLTWPFRGRYTFTLINHENEDKSHSHCLIAGKDEDPIQHFSKPISHSNGWWGEARFIDSSKLLTKKYLQNDSITLDIRVDAIC